MTKKQEVLRELLINRKREVEAYRANFEYGEWSCGQQDADADEAEYWDKTMKVALTIVDGTDARYKISDGEREAATTLIKEVLEDFTYTITHFLENW